MSERIVIAERLRLLRPHRRNGISLLKGTMIEVPIGESETFIRRGWAVSEGLIYDDPPKRRQPKPRAVAPVTETNEATP